MISEHKPLRCVWIGVPCGTASRAREIRRGQRNEPIPLRSEPEPWGRTDISLSAKDAERVRKANELYRFTLRVVDLCEEKGIAWAIENPLNSLVWYCQEFQDLLNINGVSDLKFSACMFGGKRNKNRGSVAASMDWSI